MQKASLAYMQTQITTNNQGELLLMLYTGAINFLTKAKQEIENKNYAEKGMLISKAMDIISELDGSLNMEKGAELSRNLHQLYLFCNSHLLEASLKMNAKFVNDVINILDGLRSAYAEVINTPEALSALEQAPVQNLSTATPKVGGAPLFNDPTAIKAPTGPAALGISARAQSAAYIQQAHAAKPVAAPAEAQAAAPQAAAQPDIAPTAPVAPPAGQAQTAAQALQGLAQEAQQAVPATPPSQTGQNAEPQADAQPAAQGFARQMAGSALYRKMSNLA